MATATGSPAVFILLGPPGAGKGTQARLLAARGLSVSAAISLAVDDAAMIARVAGRFACAGCGAGYHDSHKRPATAGVCNQCGGTTFTRRADDTAGTARARLKAYHAQTAPLIAHYRKMGVLETVDAMGSIAAIARAPGTIVGRAAA